MSVLALIAAAVTFLGADSWTVDQSNQEIVLSAAEKARVDNMDVVLREIGNPGKAGKTFEAIALVHGKVDEIYTVLQDRGRYSEFVPHVAKVEVTETNEKFGRANFTLKLPMGKMKRYRVEYWSERNAAKLRMFWKLIPWEGPAIPESETIVDTTGYWTIQPSDKDGYLLVLYHVYTDPGKIPTGLGWIVDILTKDSLPDLLKATRKRIETLYYAPKP
jgi:hypothetical protein